MVVDMETLRVRSSASGSDRRATYTLTRSPTSTDLDLREKAQSTVHTFHRDRDTLVDSCLNTLQKLSQHKAVRLSGGDEVWYPSELTSVQEVHTHLITQA